MENGTQAQFRGTKLNNKSNKNKTNTHHASWFPVFRGFFSCKRSLFVQTRTESGQITTGTSLSTQATTTHRPVQHQPEQHVKRLAGEEIQLKFQSCAQCSRSQRTHAHLKMELLQKHWIRVQTSFLIKGPIILIFFVPTKHYREGMWPAIRGN